MRKARVFVIIAAFVTALFWSSSSAEALPSYTSKCSGCHRLVTSAKVMPFKVTRTAANTYRVTATGARGMAVFYGTKKVASKSSGAITFKTVKGRTYVVFAVNRYPTGYKKVSFVAK